MDINSSTYLNQADHLLKNDGDNIVGSQGLETFIQKFVEAGLGNETEAKTAFQRLAGEDGVLSQIEIAAILQTADTDGNGAVDAQETAQFYAAVTSDFPYGALGQYEQNQQTLFDDYADSNGYVDTAKGITGDDGVQTREEFVAAYTQAGLGTSQGAIPSLDFAEANAAFDDIDTNNDGILDLAEIAAVLQVADTDGDLSVDETEAAGFYEQLKHEESPGDIFREFELARIADNIRENS